MTTSVSCSDSFLEQYLTQDSSTDLILPCKDKVITRRYWARIQEVLDYVEKRAAGCVRVLEVGPGLAYFKLATHFVDNMQAEVNANINVTVADVTKDRLPFEDKYFDFVYCRHTLEDLLNPMHAFQEMVRVAKRGYFETPSPLVELCHNVDGRCDSMSPSRYKGYMHHHFIVYEKDNVLHFLPKMPLVEHLSPYIEDKMAHLANNFPLYWNTYYHWDDESKPAAFVLDKMDNKCNETFTRSYNELLRTAVLDGLKSTNKQLDLMMK